MPDLCINCIWSYKAIIDIGRPLRNGRLINRKVYLSSDFLDGEGGILNNRQFRTRHHPQQRRSANVRAWEHEAGPEKVQLTLQPDQEPYKS